MKIRYELTGFEGDPLPDEPYHGRCSIWLNVHTGTVYSGQTLQSDQDSVLLGYIEARTVVESLEDWLVEREDRLVAVARAVHDGAAEAPVLQQRLMVDFMKAEVTDFARWMTPDEWLAHEGRTQIHVADEALALDSFEAVVDLEIDHAISKNIWVSREDMERRLRQILIDERSEIESDWPEDDPSHIHTREEMHRRLHALRLVLGETHPQPEPILPSMSNDEMIAFQTRLVTAIRGLPREDIVRARMAIRGLDIERPIDDHMLLCALAAACHDHDIWNAVAHVRLPLMGDEE